jgi:hypothetical protein
VWKVCLQVHLGTLVFFRKLGEGRSDEFSFDQVFVTVGVPPEWASTIQDLGRLNTVSLIADIGAYLSGETKPASERQSYLQILAADHFPIVSGVGAGMGAGILGTLAKITVFSTGGATTVAAVSFFGFVSVAGHLAQSPFWSSRNVSFLREVHDDFMANEPVGSMIAHQVFTAVWNTTNIITSCFSQIIVSTTQYLLSFIFTIPLPMMAGPPITDTMNQTALLEEILGVTQDLKGSFTDLAEIVSVGSFWDVVVILLRFIASIFFI